MSNKIYHLFFYGFVTLLIIGCSLLETKEHRSEKISLIKLFPEEQARKAEISSRILASPLLDLSQQQPRIIVPFENGTIALLNSDTGNIISKIQLPSPNDKCLQISATPVIEDNYLIVVYQLTVKGLRVSHHLAVIDLEHQKLLDDIFPALELTAEVPASDGSGIVKFNPQTAYPHSAVKYVAKKDEDSGLIYVAFGGAGDIQPYHGWLFEIDMDAWREKGIKAAISSVLVTTPEAECPVKFDSGNREMICGGGIWTPAGPQVDVQNNGFELLVPTGNGQIDLARHDYANALMRIKPGLRFDPECDKKLCANFNPANPSIVCLESCKNLFIPRLDPDDEPLRPANGDCDDKTFWECLAWMDYDLGANAPVKVNLKNGLSVWVQPGKEGGVYMVDADHLGTQYDRMQIIDVCGTTRDPCYLDWRGMIVTQPVVATIDEKPIVIIPTFISDETHAAGLIALEIVLQQGKPKFKKLWQFSGPPNKKITESFRSHPTLPVLTKPEGSNEWYVWIAEIDEHGSLYGVRVRDGTLAAQISLVGTGQPLSTPLYYNNTIYIPSNAPGIKKAWLEGYRIIVDN